MVYPLFDLHHTHTHTHTHTPHLGEGDQLYDLR
jgi:hypothetical protein